VDVNTILSWEDLKASAEELLPTALAVTILYLNIYLLPKERLEPIIKSSEEFEKYVPKYIFKIFTYVYLMYKLE
jgi:hypothetical protein